MGIVHKPNLLKPRHCNRGMSVVEVIVAFSVIGFVALGSAAFFSQQRSLLSNFTPEGECKAVLEGQMNYFRQQGMAPTGIAWDHPASAAAPLLNASGYDDPWLSSQKRLAPLANVQLAKAGAPTESRFDLSNHVLQRGAMGILNSLYNQYPNICAAPDGLDTKTEIAASGSLGPTYDTESMKDFRSFLKIQPYNLKNPTALVSCATNPLWITPQGVSKPPTPATSPTPTPTPPYNFAPNLSAEYGYRVTLKAKYLDRRDTTKEKGCTLTEDFSHPIDKQVQNISVTWSAISNAQQVSGMTPANANPLKLDGSPNSARPQCTQTPGLPASLTLRIGFSANGQPIETGTVFMCRDISEQMNPNYCMDPGKPHLKGVNAFMNGNGYNIGNALTDPQTQKWVPCSQVTACGIAPKSFTPEPGAKPGSITYKLDYENPPGSDGLWGCDIRIDVASVDLAGNFRTLQTEGGLATTKNYFQPVDCYQCLKKKKRSWASFAVVSIISPILACAAGVGGVCRPKGLKYVKHSCQDVSEEKMFCRKEPVNRPGWAPKPKGCAPKELTVPAGYTLPEGVMPELPSYPEGIYSAQFRMDDEGKYCDIQGDCQGGQWKPVPFEDDTGAPFIECGRTFTQHKISIANTPVGSPAPPGAPVCVVPLPDIAGGVTMPGFNIYNGFKVCDPAVTGLATKALCFEDLSTTMPKIVYPDDARTNDPGNMDPDNYYYYSHNIPANKDLPVCENL